MISFGSRRITVSVLYNHNIIVQCWGIKLELLFIRMIEIVKKKDISVVVEFILLYPIDFQYFLFRSIIHPGLLSGKFSSC